MLALSSLAHARDRAHVQVRLPADLPAAASRQLLSALEAQLGDLASIDVSASSAARPLCLALIASAPGGLSIQFAASAGEPLAAPRLVAGAPGELAASQIASILRAFVVARLSQGEVSAPSASEAPSAGPAKPAVRAVEAVPKPLDGAPAPAPVAPPNAPGAAQRAPKVSADPPSARKPSAAPNTLPPDPVATIPPAGDPARPPTQSAPAPLSRPHVAIDRPAPHERPPWRLRLAAFYTGMSYAPELPWQSGLRAEASARLTDWTYLGVSYAYHVPALVDASTVRLRVSSHTLSAFFGLGRTWNTFGAAIDAALGGVDRVRSTTYAAQDLTRDDDSQRWSLLAALRLHGRVRFPGAPWFALDLAPALELNPGARRSVVEQASKSAVLSPRFVRVRVDLGASFDVF